MLAALPIFLGCWTPNEFTAVVTVKKNGDYTITYNGTIFEQNIAKIASESTEKDPRDDVFINSTVADLIENSIAYPGIRSHEYIGDGLFNISFSVRGNLWAEKASPREETSWSFIIFQIEGGKTARFEFSPIFIQDERNRAFVEKLVTRMDGRFEVYSELPIVRCVGNPERHGNHTAVWRIKGWRKGQPHPTVFIALQNRGGS